MSKPTADDLHIALNHDLGLTNSEGLNKVVNDAVRKIFTARVSGAVLEFPYKQPNIGYWKGVKYYGSGSNSQIRIRRTPQA